MMWRSRSQKKDRKDFSSKNISIAVLGRSLEYSRTRVLISGMKLNGWNVVRKNIGERSWLLRQVKILLYILKTCQNIQCYMLPALNTADILAFRLGTWLCRKPLIYDALISLHETLVFDRKRVKLFHPKGIFSWLLDFIAIQLADIIVYDTVSNKKFFQEKFKANPKKGIVVLVGAEDLFYFCEPTMLSCSYRKNNILVLWYGWFSPLHGIDIILNSALYLQEIEPISGLNIRFLLIGQGQMLNFSKNFIRGHNLRNVIWLPPVSYDLLPHYISRADIGLGIFGGSRKALRVIPNKVYQMAAAGKPVITMESPAIREVFTPNYDIITVRRDPQHLARSIIELARDEDKRILIGQNARLTMTRKGLPAILAREFIDQTSNILEFSKNKVVV